MKIPRLRWFLCLLLFAATGLCFLDRQVLSVVAPAIRAEFEMSNTVYGYTTTAFLVSYAVMFLLGGVLVDRMGVRWGLGLSVAFWSLASALHGLIVSPLQLGLARFGLGFGEGACFPGAAKAVSEWFPPKERALAVGIAIGGASLGGVLAPPLTAWCFAQYGWRAAFFMTGLFGALWALLWFVFYHRPDRSPFITPQEKSHLAGPAESGPAPPAAAPQSLLRLLARRDVAGLALARFLFDPVFYFYMFWIPQFLHQERGLSIESIGALTWIPFLALGISNMIGGYFSDRLVRRGFRPSAARKGVMVLAAVATMSSGVAAFSPSPSFAIAMMSILLFAHGFWITNYVALIGDRFAPAQVGRVMGITGMVGTVGGMFANTGIGFIADHFGFFSVWLISGILYPLAAAAVLLLVRENGLRPAPRPDR